MTTLRERRIELGLTQEEVANRCGISRAYYTQIESGTAPMLPVGIKVAVALQSTVEDLFGHLNPLADGEHSGEENA